MVATPGRCIDFLIGIPYLGIPLCVDQLAMLVLDEADRMMHAGFLGKIRQIARMCPPRAGVATEQNKPARQTLFFTATWPEEVRSAAKELVGEAATTVMIEQAGGALTASTSVTQQVEVLEYHNEKLPKLKEILEVQNMEAGKCIVFCQTKKRCDWLAKKLVESASWVRALHSDKTQREREETLAAFRGAECSANAVLVATNVASRGLDIRDVKFVVSCTHLSVVWLIVCTTKVIYDFGSASDYVHQIGRTGRATQVGRAVTFYVAGDGDAAALTDILREAKQQVPNKLIELAKREIA